MNKEILKWLGAASGAVIAAGVIAALLGNYLDNFETTILEEQKRKGTFKEESFVEIIFANGIGFIIPGIIGLIAALVHNNCMPTAGVVIFRLSQQPMLGPGLFMMLQANGQPVFNWRLQANGQPVFNWRLQANGQPVFNWLPQANGQPVFNWLPQANGQPGHNMMPQAYVQPINNIMLSF